MPRCDLRLQAVCRTDFESGNDGCENTVGSIGVMIPELFLVFTGGLLGSAHCVGMCGGFALSIGASSINWRRNFARQFVYSAGRIATYTSIGAIVAYAGLQLNRAVADALPVQSILALLAGVLLIVQGLLAAGVVRSSVRAAQGACLMPRFLGAFLLAPGLGNAFFAGVFTGFLPCGLVYAFLALASATQNMFAGWLTMLAFGLGTMPIMVLTGLGGGLLTFRCAAGCFRLPAGVWCLPACFRWRGAWVSSNRRRLPSRMFIRILARQTRPALICRNARVAANSSRSTLGLDRQCQSREPSDMVVRDPRLAEDARQLLEPSSAPAAGEPKRGWTVHGRQFFAGRYAAACVCHDLGRVGDCAFYLPAIERRGGLDVMGPVAGSVERFSIRRHRRLHVGRLAARDDALELGLRRDLQ